MENENNKTSYSIIIGIVAVVLIVLGIYTTFFRGSSSTENTPVNTETEQGYENKLVLEDQFPGNTVYISSLSLKKSGFAVVYSNDGGELGKVIGIGSFTGGTNPGNITLTENTIEGRSYFVVLHDDTNGDKTFNPNTDLILKDMNGNQVISSFRATTKLPAQK